MRILFICTGNCFRSPVAEALAGKYLKDVKHDSAGTHPTDFIAENGKRFIDKEDATKFLKDSPENITQEKIDKSDVIVCMEEKHRKFIKKNFKTSGKNFEVWDIKDPVIPRINPETAFEKIKEKVEELKKKS